MVQFNSTGKYIWNAYHALGSVLSLGYKYRISTQTESDGGVYTHTETQIPCIE